MRLTCRKLQNLKKYHYDDLMNWWYDLLLPGGICRGGSWRGSVHPSHQADSPNRSRKTKGSEQTSLGAHWFTFRGPTAKNRLRRARGWKNCRLVIELSKKGRQNPLWRTRGSKNTDLRWNSAKIGRQHILWRTRVPNIFDFRLTKFLWGSSKKLILPGRLVTNPTLATAYYRMYHVCIQRR